MPVVCQAAGTGQRKGKTIIEIRKRKIGGAGETPTGAVCPVLLLL